VRDADIICTVTAAREPVLRGAWLAPGAHINAVGSSVPPFRELDTQAVVRSRVFVDMRECALRESDDLLEPIREGVLRENDVAGELCEMVTGACELRTSPDQITLFKSVGMAIEDVAAARLVYERALASGAAAYVDF
jgi:ornithine cyclodeaminase